MQTLINNSYTMRNKVKLKQHGPATQMDVYRSSGFSGPKFYSVDVVPAFEVNGCTYVAKPIKNETMSKYYWRQSYSVEEKGRLVGVDKGNECRKQVFRILKVLRNREPGLSLLTSYHLKTALFREMKKDVSWTSEDLGQRLMGVIGQVEQALLNRTMPHFYIVGVDLLMGMGDEAVKNMACRMSKVRTNKQAMMGILT